MYSGIRVFCHECNAELHFADEKAASEHAEKHIVLSEAISSLAGKTSEPACKDCRFSINQQQPNGVVVLFCRRNPPTCVPVPVVTNVSPEEQRVAALRGGTVQTQKQQLVMRSLWPAMAPEDWCHQFEARRQPPN